MRQLSVLLTTVMATIACNENTMSASRAGLEPAQVEQNAEAQPTSEGPSPSAQEAPQPGDQPTGSEPSPGPRLPVPQAPAIVAECLKGFKNPPFTPEELAKPHVIEISDANRNGGVLFSDLKTTEKPHFMILTVTMKNVNDGAMDLKNAKGWYCVDLETKNANNFYLNIGCGTTVATLNQAQHVANGFTITRDSPCPTP